MGAAWLGAAAVAVCALAACTSSTPPPMPTNSATSAPPSAVVDHLRPCASLVGKTAYSAIRGNQVTCSFGGDHPRAVNVSVLQCPTGSPYYVFYSTASDATDKTVYYGSEATLLFATTRAGNNVAKERANACAH